MSSRKAMSLNPPHGPRRAWRISLLAMMGFLLAGWAWMEVSGPDLSAPGAAVAHAQTAPAPAPSAKAAQPAPAARGESLLTYIWYGGWIGAVIIICSVIGVSLAITFAFQLRRDTLVPPEVLGQVEQCFEEENYEEAYQICEGNPSFFSAILAAGLAKIGQGYEEIEKAMMETGEVESNKLHQKVGWLSLIAAIAPMLGLFGTVAGMIDVFAEIAGAATQPKPADLARGIFRALVTTYEGLLVAIPMTVLFVVFRNKVVGVILEVGTLSEELMSRFKTRQPSAG